MSQTKLITKSDVFDLLAVAFTVFLLCGVGYYAGYWSGRNDERALASHEMMQVSNCTLEDAHNNRCTIPCSTDTDCYEKNGDR